MAEYIEREAALEESVELYYWCGYEDRYGYFVPVDAIQRIPAADVAPVRHARWEWLGHNRLIRDCMCGTCSACKVRSKYIVNKEICPNCGAKMGGGDK